MSRCVVGAATLYSASMGALAQVPAGAAPAASSPSGGQVADDAKAVQLPTQTVVVSATRRREPIREVPLQVEVIPAADLQNSGAKTLNDYLANEPGVNVKTQGGAGNATVTIRGVSAGDEIAPLVGIYVDDVAIGSSSAWANGNRSGFDMGLLDLHHIEVLKGPQGTLYGASTMGGLLKYVTNAPDTSEFSGSVSVGASTISGGGTGNTVSGVVNIPLSQDVAAVRFSGFRDQAAGYVDETGLAPRDQANRGTSTGFRASALLEPSARLHVRLTAMTEDIRRDGVDWVAYGSDGRPLYGNFIGGQAVQQPYSARTALLTADLEYDFGWARLNSISSTQHRNNGSITDFSLYAGFLPGAGIATVPYATNFHQARDTQEFRLTSRAGGAFEWIAGLYYNHESGKADENLPSTLADGTAGPLLENATIPTTFNEAAVYGDATWNPTSRLSLTAGLRVAHNSQKLALQASGLLVGPAESVDNSSSETSKTYLATARYALTPESNIYVRAASGYRPGGPNTPIYGPGGALAVPATYKHDALWSYEAGYKADLLDKKLSVSASLFDIRWRDIQQYAHESGLSYITNAGKADIHGVEFASTYVPNADWKLFGNLTYTDGKTLDASPIAASGVTLPNSAKVSTSVGGQFNFAVSGYASYLGLVERYVSTRHAGFAGSTVEPDLRLPGYAIADLQAGIDFRRAQLALFVRNLFNRRAELNATSQFYSLGGPWQVQVQQPLTTGVALTIPF